MKRQTRTDIGPALAGMIARIGFRVGIGVAHSVGRRCTPNVNGLWATVDYPGRGRGYVRVIALMIVCVTLGVMTAAAPDRPRDPWVFRCVLDGNPRMVVIALHEDLWLAFDANSCTLHKAWQGDVRLQGAVYDHVHGPQPVVRGTVLLDGTETEKWSLSQNREPIDAEAIWKGYRTHDDGVTLMYELRSADGRSVSVEETIDVADADDESITLVRQFDFVSDADQLAAVIALPEYLPGGEPLDRDLRNVHHSETRLILGEQVRRVYAKRIAMRVNQSATLEKTLKLPGNEGNHDENDEREGR